MIVSFQGAKEKMKKEVGIRFRLVLDFRFREIKYVNIDFKFFPIFGELEKKIR